MKQNQNLLRKRSLGNPAFTLIELLVVVLIIGILAAVALPQYRKSVLKSRFAEPLSVLPPLKDAMDRCFLVTGDYWECGFDVLDVAPPGTPLLPSSFVAGNGTQTKYFYYTESNYIQDWYKKRGPAALYVDRGNVIALFYDDAGNLRCGTNNWDCAEDALASTEHAQKVCSMLGIEYSNMAMLCK